MLFHSILFQKLPNTPILKHMEQNQFYETSLVNLVISISSLFSASIYYTKFVVNKSNCQGKIERWREKRQLGSTQMLRKSWQERALFSQAGEIVELKFWVAYLLNFTVSWKRRVRSSRKGNDVLSIVK